MRTMLLFAVIAMMMVGRAVAGAEPELKGSATDLAGYLSAMPGQIRITGTGEVTVEANRAVLQLRVQTKDKLLQRALEKNRKVRDEIVHTLTGKGFDKGAVQVSKFSSTPVYGFLSKKADAYDVRSSVKIHAVNEDEVHAVAGLIDTLVEVSLEAMRFEHSDEDRMRQKAVAAALDQILAQKKLYEERLGVTLRARGFPPPPASARPGRDVLGGAETPETIRGILADPEFEVVVSALAQTKSTPDISQFDQVQQQVRVTVIFDVLPQDGNRP